MQIIVENENGRQILPMESVKQKLPLYDNCFIAALDDKETVWIEHNGNEHCFFKPGEYTFPIEWDRTNKCSFSIRNDNGLYKYQFQMDNIRLPEEDDIENLLKFVTQMKETFSTEKTYQINDMFKAISENKVSLLIEKTPYTGYDNLSLLKRIAETVPLIMDICSHPKMSLKSEEAILDVNLVKRINSRTMDHLASHSEHWKSRSLTGLTPNRLRADIFDDEINIYENLFFRMAVDDILKYVHRQSISIEKTIQQNDNAIDWNAYGETLADYKRMRVFRQLLPDYDVDEHQTKNQSLRTLLDQWKNLEKKLSTVEASRFFRSIDKKKRISRNIQPTNILKKDSRYNALYRLWCEVHRQIVQEQRKSENINGNEAVSLANGYSMYVSVLLLYVFKLLEYEMDNSSTFVLTSKGTLKIDAAFSTNTINYRVRSAENRYGTLDIMIDFIERIRYEYQIPAGAIPFADEIGKKKPAQTEIDLKEQKLIFYAKPSDSEQKQLKNLFHLSNSAKKGLNTEVKNAMQLLDKIWRPELEALFLSGEIRDARTETVVIRPQFINLEDTDNAVDRYTKTVLDSATPFMIFTVPVDIGELSKTIRSPRLASRLLNYGEKYYDCDAEKWGDYRVGILPISQLEINSAQRLMKLISIHASKLQIRWHPDKSICPICGSFDCREESGDNWKCNNPECGVLFGITRHADGCGQNYEWTRPFIDLKKKDLTSSSYFNLLLRKEIIFDRLAITDFEFEEETDGRLKYIPICPRCGKTSR